MRALGEMTRKNRRAGPGIALLAASMAVGGCKTAPKRAPLAPIPMSYAAGIVNDNVAKIAGALRASGHVDGRATTPEGRNFSYHLDGILFYLAPTYVRFDLKHFGDRQFLLGCNAESYWVYDKESGRYQCARHGEPGELAEAIPIPPRQIVDALGLSMIPVGGRRGDGVGCAQRIVDEYQQILFVDYDAGGKLLLQKEFWLDRYPPRLVRRVLFRDREGGVEMESLLDDYRPVVEGGPQLPYSMTAVWPKQDAEMRFRVSNWRVVEEIGPDGVQFARPRECDDR